MNVDLSKFSTGDFDRGAGESKMIQAFGVPLLNTDGGPRNDFWGKIWERVIRLRGKQYRLPGGALGRKFTSIYSDEINALARGEKKSEISVCFAPLMLQKDKNVKTTKDMRRLIHRRIEMRQEQKIDLLIQEAEKCDKKLPISCSNLLVNEQYIFSHLMMESKIRKAT